MTLQFKEIVDRVLTLPSNSRERLAEILLESLDFEDDFPVNEDWLSEIKNRCNDIDENKVELVSGDDGINKLKRKYS